jgi:hypothetical protein
VDATDLHLHVGLNHDHHHNGHNNGHATPNDMGTSGLEHMFAAIDAQHPREVSLGRSSSSGAIREKLSRLTKPKRLQDGGLEMVPRLSSCDLDAAVGALREDNGTLNEEEWGLSGRATTAASCQDDHDNGGADDAQATAAPTELPLTAAAVCQPCTPWGW